jgi:hypothetical protein
MEIEAYCKFTSFGAQPERRLITGCDGFNIFGTKINHMKQFVLFCLLALGLNTGMAQNMEDLFEMVQSGKYKEAKVAIDKYLSNPKKQTDPDGWYIKGRVYNALSRDSSLTFTQSYNLKMEAFEAFQKNQELDKKDVRMKMDEYISYFDIYAELYNAGIKNYNSKDFEGAYTAFKKTNEVKDFILSKNYKYDPMPLVAFDTALIMNIAICAHNANRDNEMYVYYQKIVDANIVGKDYKDVYQLLIEQKLNNGMEEDGLALLSKSKKLYPGDDVWTDIEIKQAESKGGKAGLMKKYEDLTRENPSSFVLHYNYSVELYNCLYGKEATNSGDTVMAKKLTQMLQQAMKLEAKEEATALVLMCNHLYNNASDVWNASQSIKSAKPEDVKKRAQLKSNALRIMDECIGYGDKAIAFYEAIPDKSPMQNANYKIILGYMSDLYSTKKDPVKAAIYEKKNAAADKL